MPMQNEVVIYDLEYTTWPGALKRGWSGKNEYKEITWVAAIVTDVESLEEIDSFSCIMKPNINPVLSDYFVELTGLTNERLTREGVSFFQGIQAFHHFVNSRPMLCHGWDTVSMLENLKLNNIQFRAKRLGDACPIEISLSKTKANELSEQADTANGLLLNVYGSGIKVACEATQGGIVYEVDFTNKDRLISPTTYIGYDIRPWFNENAPETIHRDSGELAATLGKSVIEGNNHEPLFDVRSLLNGARHLIQDRDVDNVFMDLIRRVQSIPKTSS